MPQFANAILTKARAIYGRRLSPAQYGELLRKQSVQEISAFLREKTSFSHALAGVQDSTIHRGQLESLLRRDILYQYSRLVHYVPTDERIYAYVVMDAEIELLLSCVANLISGKSNKDAEFVASLPAFLKPYASFDIYSLVEVKDLAGLARAVEHSPYGPLFLRLSSVRRPEDRRLNYADFEYELRKFYFELLLRNTVKYTRGKTREQLSLIIRTRAEMLNLNTIYRMKAYFGLSPGDIRRAMLPFEARIKPKLLRELTEAKDPHAFMLLLSQRTPYKRLVDQEETFIESQTDRIRSDVYRRLMRFSTSPEVVYTAFMLLREMEVENITRIIEGVRYQVPPDQIESLLYKI